MKTPLTLEDIFSRLLELFGPFSRVKPLCSGCPLCDSCPSRIMPPLVRTPSPASCLLP